MKRKEKKTLNVDIKSCDVESMRTSKNNNKFINKKRVNQMSTKTLKQSKLQFSGL